MYYLLIPAVAVVLLLLAWHKIAYAPYRLFKSLGIPNAPVSPFFGNTLQLNKHGHEEFMKNCIKNYGKVFGYYVGSMPYLTVLDLDILNEILVKQFSIFHDRTKKERNVMTIVFGKFPGGLVFLNGDDWKHNRTIVSPSFTTKKFKAMAPLIEKRCDSLNDQLEQISKANESSDIWKLFRQFTIQTILATAFGHDTVEGENDEITETANNIFFSNTTMMSFFWADTFGSQLPFVRSAAGYFVPRSKFGVYFHRLCDIAVQLVEKRKRETSRVSEYKDFLQILIDAKAPDGESSTKRSLTTEEIASHCLDALVGGYESTTSCLSFTAYLLATNTDKQDKLCQMIEDYYQENPDATLYDASINIPYVEWVLNESLRMYPPFPRGARYCPQTCVINGITIPKGAMIDIPIKLLHHFPEYWDEPEEFRPERFSPEEKEGRHPLCYMPFGYGPRNCVGMRYVLMEAKMVLVSVFSKYKFHTALDTQIPLKLRTGIAESPADGVFLKVASI